MNRPEPNSPGPLLWRHRLKEHIRPYYLKWIYFHLSSSHRPDYFRNCWSFPDYPLDSAPAGLASAKPGLSDLLFLPMTDWHTRIQRTQHFARTLGELGHRCFYLNPHLGREFEEPYITSGRERISLLTNRVMEVHLHLPAEPVFHHRLLSSSENSHLFQSLARLVKAYSVESLVQVVSFPIWMPVAQELRRTFGFPIVYDCHDLLGGFDAVSSEIVKTEAGHLEQSDLVVFSSEYLRDEVLNRAPELKDKSAVVRNGVHPEDFPYGFSEYRVRSACPVIGYAGALEFWFDAEAIRLAAMAHPEWRFRLIGRMESPHVEELRLLPNVELTGEVPYRELALHYAEMDVALIPFQDSPLTQAANPIKLYEYFACGLPVVSSRLTETEKFPDLLYLADSSGSFTGEIEKALQERDPSLRLRRRQVAEAESWNQRCLSLREQFSQL